MYIYNHVNNQDRTIVTNKWKITTESVACLPKRHDGGDKSAEEKADEHDIKIPGREIQCRTPHSRGQHQIDAKNDGEEE